MKDCAICAGRQFAGVSPRLLSAVSAGHVMMTDFTLRSIRSPCFRRRGRKIITPGRGTFNEDKLDFKAVESCEGREVSLRDLHGASAFRTHSSETPTCRSTWILKHADCQNFVNLWRHIPKEHLTRRVSSTRAFRNSAGSAKLVHLRCKWAALARSQIVVTCLFYKCQNQYDPHTKGIKMYRIIPPIDKSLAQRKLKLIPNQVIQVHNHSPALLDMAFTLISPVSDSSAADFTDSNMTQIKTLTFPTNSITCGCTGYKLLNDCGLNVAITEPVSAQISLSKPGEGKMAAQNDSWPSFTFVNQMSRGVCVLSVRPRPTPEKMCVFKQVNRKRRYRYVSS